MGTVGKQHGVTVLDGKRHDGHLSLVNVALTVCDPQMARTIAVAWRGRAAAELRRGIAETAERPVAAGAIEFQDRAGLHCQAAVGRFSARIEPADLRQSAASRRGHWIDFIMLDDAARQPALGAQPLGLAADRRARPPQAGGNLAGRMRRPQVDQFAGIRIGPGRHAHDKPLIMTADREMPDDLGTNLAGAMVP
jgi:hypothetical protein